MIISFSKVNLRLHKDILEKTYHCFRAATPMPHFHLCRYATERDALACFHYQRPFRATPSRFGMPNRPEKPTYGHIGAVI